MVGHLVGQSNAHLWIAFYSVKFSRTRSIGYLRPPLPNMVHKEKYRELLKLLGGFQKLSNILFNQMCPLCKHGLGGEHHQGKLINQLHLFKLLLQLQTHMEKEALKKLIPNSLRGAKDIKDMGCLLGFSVRSVFI